MTDNKTVKRVSNRGEDKREWEMKYNYKASVAVIEAPKKTARTSAKPESNISFHQSIKPSPVKKIRATAERPLM
jgi:hypothetical protein